VTRVLYRRTRQRQYHVKNAVPPNRHVGLRHEHRRRQPPRRARAAARLARRRLVIAEACHTIRAQALHLGYA
jgi:hypothetical protein